MYADTSSDKARFQPKISAAGFVCSTVFWYTHCYTLNQLKRADFMKLRGYFRLNKPQRGLFSRRYYK